MVKKSNIIEDEAIVMEGKKVIVKNLDNGNRDYALADGSTLYLPRRKKGVAWPEIDAKQISSLLKKAEINGHVKLIWKEA